MGLRCRYNHSERKNHTKFFAEPPPHWSTTISHHLTLHFKDFSRANHPLLFSQHYLYLLSPILQPSDASQGKGQRQRGWKPPRTTISTNPPTRTPHLA